MLQYHTIREVANVIDDAINQTVRGLNAGRFSHEPAMTDRMLGSIEASLDGRTIKGITWNAKTLTDRGRGSEESVYGADFMGVLDIDLPEYKVKKGFLAQAKLLREGRPIDMKELKG